MRYVAFGRAFGSHPRGQGFDSPHLHQKRARRTHRRSSIWSAACSFWFAGYKNEKRLTCRGKCRVRQPLYLYVYVVYYSSSLIASCTSSAPFLRTPRPHPPQPGRAWTHFVPCAWPFFCLVVRAESGIPFILPLKNSQEERLTSFSVVGGVFVLLCVLK